MLDIKQFSSDLIDSYLDILTFDEKLLVFKEIKIIFTRYDFDLLFPVGGHFATLKPTLATSMLQNKRSRSHQISGRAWKCFIVYLSISQDTINFAMFPQFRIL
jgi:hypothetical protein